MIRPLNHSRPITSGDVSWCGSRNTLAILRQRDWQREHKRRLEIARQSMPPTKKQIRRAKRKAHAERASKRLYLSNLRTIDDMIDIVPVTKPTPAQPEAKMIDIGDMI